MFSSRSSTPSRRKLGSGEFCGHLDISVEHLQQRTQAAIDCNEGYPGEIPPSVKVEKAAADTATGLGAEGRIMHAHLRHDVSCNGDLEVGVVLSGSAVPSRTFEGLGPTSSGRGAFAAALSSSSYLAIMAWSSWTSGGASAGAATNSRDWFLLVSGTQMLLTLMPHPTSFRASHRKGFSKL